MTVLLQPVEPEGHPPRLGLQEQQPELREAVQEAGVDEVGQAGHVLEREAHGLFHGDEEVEPPW